jgi:hypothetical protein
MAHAPAPRPHDPSQPQVADGCDIAVASLSVQPHSIEEWSPIRAAFPA